MPVDVHARPEPAPAPPARPGKVVCRHLPGHFNRFCASCDALIIAHSLVRCCHGHEQMVLPSTMGPVALWCSGCDAIAEFAA